MIGQTANGAQIPVLVDADGMLQMGATIGNVTIGTVGIDQSTPNANKVVAERWRKHKSRARNENRTWVLYEYLKMGAVDWTWTHKIIAIVRGRAEAYAYERELVKTLQPSLNDQYIG